MSKSDYLKELGDAIALSHWAQTSENTYEEICDRVVNYLCDDPSDEGRRYNHRMKELLKNKKFIPNSPCWINAGTDMRNLFACYVIDLQDNMSSIMDTAKRMAMIMKEGGGVGVSLTPIRAEGSRVGPEGSKRTASGPVSFLKVFDAVTGAVKAAGVRRGAALANLKTGHPDIIKFIRCKEDQNQINNFNLSVAVTDEFMDDVINGSDKVWAEEDGVKYTASAIYDMIVEHMWRNGEPGVQFIDTVNNVDGKYTGRPEFHEFNTGIEVSNPCVTGDTQILTDKGYFPIKDLVGKKVNIWNGFEWSEVEPRKTGENQKLLKITFSNGSEIRCTPYHRFIIQPYIDGHHRLSSLRKSAEDIVAGDFLIKHEWPIIEGTKELENAYTQGFFSGDGNIAYYKWPDGSVRYEYAVIGFYGEKIKVMSRCSLKGTDINEAVSEFNSGKIKVIKRPVNIPYIDKTFIPDCNYTIKSRLDWLAGLCDADGYITCGKKNTYLSVSSADREFLHNVGKKVLNTLGCEYYLFKAKDAGKSCFADTETGKVRLVERKELYQINIRKKDLKKLIGLGLNTSRLTLPADIQISNRIHTGSYVEVVNISECEEREDVYCLTEPKNHSFIANGIITGNCGESFLKPNEACNLGSINLYNFVHPFWKGEDKKADMALRQELKQTVEDAVDFLNLMIDKSETPFDEVNAAVRASRKTGLGVMGLADYLSAKGLTYGSPEAVHEAADVFAFITKTAEEYSLRKGYKNACLTIQAPTGTTGLVGEVSTGIEPHFLRCWNRHSLKMGDLLMYPKSLRDYINARYDSTRTDSPEMIIWIALSQAMENNDLERFSDIIECRHTTTTVEAKAISDEIKKYWPTAHEVTPKQHLAMLAAIQRHVHNSVSKTINLSHDATVDDVRELITTAWRSGCKGFTCYRDGSRDSQPLKAVETEKKDKAVELPEELEQAVREGNIVVLEVDDYNNLVAKANAVTKCLITPEKFAKDNNVPCKRPRPNVTFGETVKTKIGCGAMYITVNSDEHGICEVFTSLGRNGGCPSQSEATSRLISLALRSGVSVEDVIDQLKGIRCMNTMRQGGIKQADGTVVLSCPDAIGKTMERVYKDKNGEGLFISKMRDATPEENASIDKFIESISVPTAVNIFDALECPECGEKLTRDGGCIICRHCGYSKCG